MLATQEGGVFCLELLHSKFVNTCTDQVDNIVSRDEYQPLG